MGVYIWLNKKDAGSYCNFFYIGKDIRIRNDEVDKHEDRELSQRYPPNQPKRLLSDEVGNFTIFHNTHKKKFSFFFC